MKPADVSYREQDLVTVGRIKTVYGVKGWLKVESFTQPLENILDYRNWIIDTGSQRVALRYDDIRMRSDDIVVHFEGLDQREQAREYAQALVKVVASELPVLSDNDFYWRDLEGLAVYPLSDTGSSEVELGHWSDGRCIGTVDHMLETGANDVMVVRPTSLEVEAKGQIDNGDKSSRSAGKRSKPKEILIPYLFGSVVKEVDLARGAILVDWYLDNDV